MRRMPEPRITLSTPALLFSAISLLMLAFTNRFLALASLVRSLHAVYKERPDERLYGQIRNLRTRLDLIRWMQIAGITSLLLCVVSMLLIYVGWTGSAGAVFGIALVLMIASLGLSIWEIQISVNALNLHLSDVLREEAGGVRAPGAPGLDR
jgi:magnesium-transporting ATPase (P-type)